MGPTAERLRVKLLPVVADREDQLAAALARLERDRADALIVEANAVNNPHHEHIIPFAMKHRMPTASPMLRFVAEGGLICYGSFVESLFRRAAVYVDKILKGARPGDLPIERRRGS
jgi:putative ABC transport system substrate-binding protein